MSKEIEQKILKNINKIINDVDTSNIFYSRIENDKLKTKSIPEFDIEKKITIDVSEFIKGTKINIFAHYMEIPFHASSSMTMTIEKNGKINKIECSKDIIIELISNIENKINNSISPKI
jgi:hypothetical protein